MGPFEGLHRIVGSIQALTCSTIDPNTGVLGGANTLTFDHFSNSNLIKLEDGQTFPIDKLFADIVEDNLKSKTSRFFNTPSYVQIKWVSTSIIDFPISGILAAFRTLSRQTSDNKHTSVRKNAWGMIGGAILEYMTNVSVDHILKSPDTTKTPIKVVVHRNPATAKKMLVSARNKYEDQIQVVCGVDFVSIEGKLVALEAVTFDLLPYFFSEEYVNYCKNPFDEKCMTAVLQYFTYNAIHDGQDGTSDLLSPPFLHTHNSLTYNILGKDKPLAISTWEINTALFLPLVIHHIYADVVNTTTSDAASNACQQLVLYAVRYHCSQYGISNAGLHGVVDTGLYKEMIHNNCITTGPTVGKIVLVASLIVDIMNMSMVHPLEWEGDKIDKTIVTSEKYTEMKQKTPNGRIHTKYVTIEKIKEKLKTTGIELDQSFSSITNRSPTMATKDIIHNLGQFSWRGIIY